jgi:hypothetical protein
MTTLRYRSNVCVSALTIGECTIHRAGNASGDRWWLLWLYVNREDNGQPADFAVPVNPNGTFVEAGPGGKTWGLTKSGQGTWQVAPSINVLGSQELHPGVHEAPSQWHQTPAIVGVPDDEKWQTSPP